MPESREESPGDGYFNDLTQQPAEPPKADNADERRTSQEENNSQVPKPKRIACALCRKRKLKCDGTKPSCGTCTRLQHDCSYDEVRRKSGPKRGYVKALEARLAQVETLLKTQDEQQPSNHAQTNGQADNMVPEYDNIAIGGNMMPATLSSIPQNGFPAQSTQAQSMLGTAGNVDTNGPPEEPFPWEMIGLGLEEPLPTQDVVDDLNRLYFEKVHPSLPMIHRPRYYAAMNLAPHIRPPVCLRYAMWCNAAVVSNKYEALHEHFYQRARKYIQQDEMKGHGEAMITVAHCQAWALLATHEFKLMYFPRAWMSAGRACRMAQAMGLHRLDGTGLDVKQCIPPPKDWTEREERRRTFWMSFCVDRYSSIGTGWPMTIEEKDILTSLPADEDAYEFSKPMKTMNLPDALDPAGLPELSGFAGVILLACLFGRNLLHLHRPAADDNDDDLNGEFWKRHRSIDNILLNIALALPEALRLPSGLNNPNVVFLNMNIHTSMICLHQAAIFKADKNRMPSRISAESKIRCITAAAEIASIMRQTSHLDLATMNPFISFCLYVAARVFVQYLKSRPKDAQVKASLQFLLSALHAIKKKNPLTESFLAQLDVDLEGAGFDDSRALRLQYHRGTTNRPNKMPGCPHEHFGMRPTYGDQGMAAYNQSNQKPVDSSGGVAQSGSFVGHTGDFFSETSSYEQSSTGYSMKMPIRTPSSLNANSCPGPYKSPALGGPDPVLGGPDMDTSPDGSNNDQQTPGSSTRSYNHNTSSHTSSNPDYSPQCQQQHDQRNGNTNDDQLAAMFDPNNAMFTSDFDMQTFPTSSVGAQQSGFVLPQQWSGGPSGLTPNMGSGSGLTSGSSNINGMINGFAGNGVNEMMSGMSDQDWNSVLDDLTGWETGMDHPVTLQESMTNAYRKI